MKKIPESNRNFIQSEKPWAMGHDVRQFVEFIIPYDDDKVYKYPIRFKSASYFTEHKIDSFIIIISMGEWKKER